MLLADNDMGQEGIVLNRVMLEQTIVLHWVIACGDDGIKAVRANHSKQMRKWLGKTRNTTLEVPPEIAGEITASFDGIDEAKATGFFSDVCRQVGCEDLCAVYGIWSQTVHPSLATSNTYIDPGSGALRLAPARDHLTLHGVPAGLHTLLTGAADWPNEPKLLTACETTESPCADSRTLLRT
jgi:hypothetical protein